MLIGQPVEGQQEGSYQESVHGSKTRKFVKLLYGEATRVVLSG